ncbi:MAG: DUF4956 domain-containing protein [Oscillospiraceae bacterium]|jgi:hypothetical protein|nr:DUF4956 domain-containing protein [Oscillospiraceae bacterium]
MFDSIFSATSNVAISLGGLAASLGVSFVLGLLVSVVYIKTHKTKTPSQSFAVTLVLLPAIVAVIILLVGSNIARAFSLAGAFSIIRFRSAPGDPKDITYVLFSMATGLAAGMGFLLYAVVVGVFLCLVVVLLEVLNFGQVRKTDKILKITIPENLDFPNAFNGILEKYTLSNTLRRVKTAELGSLYELNYSVITRDGVSEKEFIDALRTRNGNLNISLVLDAANNSEF